MTTAQGGTTTERLFGNAYLMLVLTMMAWAGNAVAGKAAVGEISPMALTSLRWVFVVLLLGLFARREIREAWPVMRRRLGYLATMGAVGFTLFNALFYTAAKTTSAINIGILQGAIPIFVLLGAFVAHRASVTPVQAIGVMVTLVGVVTVTTGGDLARLLTLRFNEGDVLMVVACFFYAGYTLALRRRPPVSALAMFSVLAMAAFMASLPLAALEAAAGDWQWPTAKGWGVLLYVVLFPSFLAQLSFMQGVKLIGPSRAGVFVNLVPIFAALLSVVLLGEAFGLFHAASLVLVLGGIWLAEHAGKRPAA